jgi:tetratricopeptide (TPR) repeat protein
MLLSSREKILLHLFLESRNRQIPARVMPASFSQEGISRGTGVARKHVPRNLKGLLTKELISEEKAHIKGAPQRRKVYFPTSEGRDEAMDIKEKALGSDVILRQGEGGDGKIDEVVSLEKAIRMLCHSSDAMNDEDILLFIRCLEEEGSSEVLRSDRVMASVEPGEHEVRDLSSAPVVRGFVGREKELEKIGALLNDRRMVVIYGITGIGKSAFGSRIASSYKGNVFWYSFHEWDTMQNLQTPLARFFDEMGLSGQRFREGVEDVNEFLGILKDGLHGSNSLIVLDDVQKASDSFKDVLRGIVEHLEDMEGVVFLVLSRRIPDFYSRKDVVVRKTVDEIMLEGLDRESCITFLESRGIPSDDSEEIFRITWGHPLSMELIETPGPDIDAGNLGKYFEEEVLRKLPLAEKQILRQASIYRYPVPADALLLLPEQDYENIRHLRMNALVNETADGKFQVHDLFKRIMIEQLSSHQMNDVHRNAGDFYMTTDLERSTVEAIYHYLHADLWMKAKDLFLDQGRELIYRGYGKELLEYLDLLIEGPGELPEKEIADLITIHAEIDTVLGDWVEAEQRLNSALERYKGLKDTEGMAMVLKDLGGIKLRKGAHADAVELFGKSLDLYRECEDKSGIAKIENNLGIAYWQGGNIPKAKESLTRSLGLSEELGDQRGIARAFTNLGIIEFQHGDVKEAIGFYDRAVDLSNELGDKKTLAQLYDNLGEAYREKGDKKKALDYFDQGIELAESHDFRLITAQLCKDMSELLEGEQQDYYKGLALEICRELGIENGE